jgi:hypothetical protein
VKEIDDVGLVMGFGFELSSADVVVAGHRLKARPRRLGPVAAAEGRFRLCARQYRPYRSTTIPTLRRRNGHDDGSLSRQGGSRGVLDETAEMPKPSRCHGRVVGSGGECWREDGMTLTKECWVVLGLESSSAHL